MFVLFNFIISLGLSIIDTFLINSVLGFNILSPIYSLAVLLPSLAVFVRRLHDIDKSGWWFFINLIPIVGQIWLLILLFTEGTRGTNKYGEDPKLQ